MQYDYFVVGCEVLDQVPDLMYKCKISYDDILCLQNTWGCILC